jgi:hypothetical protein
MGFKIKNVEVMLSSPVNYGIFFQSFGEHGGNHRFVQFIQTLNKF